MTRPRAIMTPALKPRPRVTSKCPAAPVDCVMPETVGVATLVLLVLELLEEDQAPVAEEEADG